MDANNDRPAMIESGVHSTTITAGTIPDRVTCYSHSKPAETYVAVQGTEITIEDYITHPLLGAVGFTIILMRIMSRLSDAFACFSDYMIETAFPLDDLMPTLPTTIDPRKHIYKCLKSWLHLVLLHTTYCVYCRPWMAPIILLGGIIVAQWKVNKLLRAQIKTLRQVAAARVETENEEDWDMVGMQD
jgi:hypothetical protein